LANALPVPLPNVLPVPLVYALPVPLANVLPVPLANALPVPLANVLPDPLRLIVSDYLFGIHEFLCNIHLCCRPFLILVWPLYCLYFFDLRIVFTTLVSLSFY
jgi:hypothetical protein